MLSLPGFSDGKKGTFANALAKSKSATPPPPVTALDPVIVAAREKQRRGQASRQSTIITGQSGVLGDPPLDRPMARSATMLGGT
jgi:hypothetical protein